MEPEDAPKLGLSPIMVRAALLAQVLAVAGPVQAGLVSRNSSQPTCRPVPGEAGWPSADDWAGLNTTTGGRLIRPAPPGAVCHPSMSTYSATACAAVQAAWFDDYFHSENPVSVEWNNWNNDTCLPDQNFTCSAIGYPVYVINATTPQHVKAGIDFGASPC